jgi:alpha-D-ribose 1-methylphosphonate 5-triphosphate synthase subunit PhnI
MNRRLTAAVTRAITASSAGDRTLLVAALRQAAGGNGFVDVYSEQVVLLFVAL